MLPILQQFGCYMKNLYVLCAVLSLVSALEAADFQLEHPIFSCLTQSNYTCLEREISINPNWHRLKNAKKQSPLRVALGAQNGRLVMYLLKAGAKVKNKDIELAMRFFFDVPQKALESKTINKTDKPSFSRRLILAAIEDSPAEEGLAEISKILDIFSSREEIALTLNDLFTQKNLYERSVQILMYNYENLFLQGNALTQEQFVEIIGALIPLDIPQLLLRLIVDFHDAPKPALASIIYSLPNNMRPSAMVHEMARAIIEQSRTIFLNLAPIIWLQKSPPKEIKSTQAEEAKNGAAKIKAHKEFDFAFNAMEDLSEFIKLSINSAKNEEETERRYTFWLAVYNLLEQEGDLMGAISLACGLNSPQVEKKIKPKTYCRVEITNGTNSKNYRTALAKHSGKFCIPAPHVHLHDLETMANCSLFKKGKDAELLNREQLKIYTEFRLQMGEMHQNARSRKYLAKPELVELLRNLPTESDILSGELAATFELLWPKQVSNRRKRTITF